LKTHPLFIKETRLFFFARYLHLFFSFNLKILSFFFFQKKPQRRSFGSAAAGPAKQGRYVFFDKLCCLQKTEGFLTNLRLSKKLCFFE
jgi:hypothetical protein